MRLALLAASTVAVAAAAAAPALAQDQPERGRYLATIMDCGGCHTEGALIGQPDPKLEFAGSTIGFGVPGYGYVFPPNLTSDPETGLGKWSAEDIKRAITTGERPDGRILVVMPWPHYSALTPEDATALASYIKSLPPIRHQVPPLTGADQPQPGPVMIVK
jgi:mono/diheme cytochrome c family protein